VGRGNTHPYRLWGWDNLRGIAYGLTASANAVFSVNIFPNIIGSWHTSLSGSKACLHFIFTKVYKLKGIYILQPEANLCGTKIAYLTNNYSKN